MRNLVICLDGTWNTPDQRDRGRQIPSNVVKMARAVATRTATPLPPQVVYYDTGVGTRGVLDRFIGGVTGYGISENIRAAYRWLIEHFRHDDRIFLFGFSRGAYSVRSLAGLIGICGIPQQYEGSLDDVVKQAYAIYRDKKPRSRNTKANRFVERTNANRADLHFIGVWDTVGALGVPTRGPIGWWTRRRSGFHDVNLGSHIKHAFHALAINERRGPFQPALWSATTNSSRVVVQAWFPGVHSNIGGGYVDNGLSDRALLWMIYNANAHGLCFDENYINLSLRPNWFGELRDSLQLHYHLMLWNRPRDREIRSVSPATEHLHVSVRERWHDVTKPDNPPPRILHLMKSKSFHGSEWEANFNLANRLDLTRHHQQCAVCDGSPVHTPDSTQSGQPSDV